METTISTFPLPGKEVVKKVQGRDALLRVRDDATQHDAVHGRPNQIEFVRQPEFFHSASLKAES